MGQEKNLPQDPFILLSYINTKLRDEYRSLELLCEDFHITQQVISDRLKAAGYVYDPQANQFKAH